MGAKHQVSASHAPSYQPCFVCEKVEAERDPGTTPLRELEAGLGVQPARVLVWF